MITEIGLKNCRSLSNFFSHTDSKVIVISGPNGSGKTSILESISLLHPGKGLKQDDLSQFIRYDHSQAEIGCKIKNNIVFEVIARIEQNKKNVSINGSQSSIGEVSKLIAITSITPQMSDFFIGPIAQRRNWLDRIAYKLNLSHAKSLKLYETLTKNRIDLLEYNSVTLDSIESQISVLSLEIFVNRENAIKFLDTNMKKISEFGFVSGKIQRSGQFYKKVISTVDLKLQQQLNENNDDDSKLIEYILDNEECKQKTIQVLFDTLKQNRYVDFTVHKTTFSVNKSDFTILIKGGQDIRMCSTAEQKLGLVSLGLSSAKENSILLLDELFCHLDSQNRSLVGRYIDKIPGQVWITTSEPNDSRYMQELLHIKL